MEPSQCRCIPGQCCGRESTDHTSFPSKRTKFLQLLLILASVAILLPTLILQEKIFIATDDGKQDGTLHLSTNISSNTSGHFLETANETVSRILDQLPIRSHPYAGAKDTQGNWGHIADVTAVRKWMLGKLSQQDNQLTHSFLPMSANESHYACNIPPGEGEEHEDGLEVLKTVNVSRNDRIGVLEHENRGEKVLCVVYTHKGHHNRIKGITETWGWRCDGFFAASTETVIDQNQIGFGSINLPHAGPESYGNMWQKTRSILAYVHEHYRDDFDYFYLSGDDTHLIVENLLVYLSSWRSRENEPLFTGQLTPYRDKVYAGGGGGYVMNRAALDIFLNKSMDSCSTTAQKSWEDRILSICFWKQRIIPIDAADSEGRQRFHGLSPHWIASNKALRGSAKASYELWGKSHGFKTGKDIVASSSVSFHLLKSPESMKRHHALLYGCCEVSPSGTRAPNSTSQ